MRHYVSNANGERIADYKNTSELITFLKASAPEMEHKPEDYGETGRKELKDKDGNLVLAVDTVK